MIKVEASFDDGSIYDLRMADIMYGFGIETTFYIPVNWKKYLYSKGIEPLKDEHVRELSKEFEIGSHGINHELLTRVDKDVQWNEIAGSKKWWKENYKIDVKKFCYPRGYYTEAIKKLVMKAGYESARTTRVGELTPIDPYELPTTIHVGIDRKEYGCNWLAYGKKMIEQALEHEARNDYVVFHFWGHSEEVHRNDQWDNLIRFMELLDENILS